MITELHIENLGVIEHVSMQFGSGLTALTGETGAGKTMLVEAIELLVGGRADSGVVRHGATEARVDGRLLVREPDGTGRELVLTRIIPAEGRSRAYVDGRPATVSHLTELCRGVIDLHGQHEHQSLLSVATQRAALDLFAGTDLEPLRRARAELHEIDTQLAGLGGDAHARAREIDLLRYQVDEIEHANIEDPHEDAALAIEESLLADAVASREATAAVVALLGGDDGADERIGEAIRLLAARPGLSDFAERLSDLVNELDELTGALRDRGESIDENPQRLDEIRQRRQLLVDLRRKYGADLSEVMTFQAETARRLDELIGYEERVATLENDRTAALALVKREAERVAHRRRNGAQSLAGRVEEQLRELAMPDARIEILFADDPDDLAADGVTFCLAANPGLPPAPLQRVASGGELARAMLALRLVLSDTEISDASTSSTNTGGPSTLVFDEVDAGIGGSAAVAVGRALSALGGNHQVLVVTHLPQVAAVADAQLLVAKMTGESTTSTEVETLEHERRVDEIARMLSGEVSVEARDHARSLLERHTG